MLSNVKVCCGSLCSILFIKKIKDLELVRKLFVHNDYLVIKQYLNYTREGPKAELGEVFKEISILLNVLKRGRR